MVTVQKLTLQGFKSFKRKTAIPFPTGFSVITGPNGSGKSNIIDAFTFVLGTRSSHEMRAKKGEDLIYGGSKVKEGSDYAFVSLTFDNSKKMLPVEDHEVVISRKLNKQGVSTYRINGRVATKQHIAAILAQAQIHADGHNIIKQGDVNEIVEMDSVERRQILDELSGIKEYDEKKGKAMKELESIDSKVKEAEILLNEKGSIVGKLKQERDSALAFREMNSDLEKVKASIIWKENEETGGELGEVEKRLNDKTADMQKLESESTSLDNEISGYEKDLEEMTKQLFKASSQVEESKRLIKLQGEAERLRDRMESNEREIERLGSMAERLSSLDDRINPVAKSMMGQKGVFGTLGSLISVPKNYAVAAEVAAGGHMQDIIVDSMETAVSCVNQLKASRMGRARFLPLDRISSSRGSLPAGAIGWMSDLVKYDKKYSNAVLYALGSTACVDSIEKARSLSKSSRTRMVTLDGDLVESSGAVTGGFYKKKVQSEGPEVGQFIREKARLEDDNITISAKLRELNAEIEKLADKDKNSQSLTFEKGRIKYDEKLKAAREKRKAANESKLAVQQEMGRLSVQKARLEARFDNAKAQLETFESGGKKISVGELKPFVDMNLSKLRNIEKDTILKLNSLGQINFKAIEEFESIREEFEEFKQKVDKIVEEKNKILDTVTKIESKRLETFTKTLDEVSRHFKDVYSDLTGGEAQIGLEVPNNMNSGLMISAAPSNKKLLSLDSLSGGEKTLTAFAFLFALKRHKPSPFYILDEADATLDKSNTRKVVDLLKRNSIGSQFIIISHNDNMIREADRVYGVTMNEGESKVIAIELPQAAQAVMQKNN